jgi:hypothetical protein
LTLNNGDQFLLLAAQVRLLGPRDQIVHVVKLLMVGGDAQPTCPDVATDFYDRIDFNT